MTDPPRLLQNPSGLGATLLAAGRDELPREAAMRRTLTAVGAGAAVLTASSAAGGALVSGAAGSAVAKGSASSAGLALAAKWVFIGTVGGAATATAAYELAPSAREAANVAPAVVVTAPPPKKLAMPSPVRTAPVQADEPAAADLELGVAPAAPTAGRTEAAASPRAEAASEELAAPLAAEVVFVDRGRASFQAGDFVRALTHLARYEQEFPGRRLLAEVLFLRMEAQTALGDTASAQAAAQRILAAYPKSPHAARARVVLGAR